MLTCCSVEGQMMDIKELRAGAKEFMTNPANSVDLPEKRRVTAAECQQKIGEFKSYVASAANAEAKDGFQKSLDKWEDKLTAVKLLANSASFRPTRSSPRPVPRPATICT